MLAGLTRELRTSVLAIVAFTVLLGLAYPLAITGIAQVAFRSHRSRSSTRPTARSSCTAAR